MSATQIVNELQQLFAPLDAEVLEASQRWAVERVKALKAFKESEEYTAHRGDSWGLYAKLYAVAGGKTWYNVFTGRSASMIAEFVAKNCAAVAAARNARIAAKLTKAGVAEVLSSTFTHSSDGFNGVFRVMTDKGEKVVVVETIRAGGYNVQCLHLRVLCKVR